MQMTILDGKIVANKLKDEIKEKILICTTYDEVKAIIDDWIDYYNNDLYNFIISSFVGSFGFPGLQASSIAD